MHQPPKPNDGLKLANVTVSPGGYALYWPEEGAGIEISSILAGRFGSRKWIKRLRAETLIPLGLWADRQEARTE